MSGSFFFKILFRRFPFFVFFDDCIIGGNAPESEVEGNEAQSNNPDRR